MRSEDKYYVYEVTFEGETIYVGKGQGSRVNHVLSGKSHNRRLNEYVFRHELLSESLPSVHIVQYFSEESLAFKFEEYLIRDKLPECNIRLCAKPKIKTKAKAKTKISRSKAVKKVKVKEQSKDTLFSLPSNYDNFCRHIEDLYSESEERGCVTNLRSFVYSKQFSPSWEGMLPWITRFLEELPDNRKGNGGHNMDNISREFSLDKVERKKLNNFKTYYKKTKGVPPSEEEVLAKINKIRGVK